LTDGNTVAGDGGHVQSTAHFARDEDRFTPRTIARGGWGESVSGHVVGGILAWAAERLVEDPQMQPARLTVDIPRPMALAPVELETRVLRDGKRLRLIESVATQDGNAVARATALFLRRGPQPEGQRWSPELHMPPIPDDFRPDESSLFVRTYGWGAAVQNPESEWPDTGPKYTWVYLSRPIVDGEPPSAFVIAAMAGDITASLANWDSNGLQFINADYTVTLSRLPEGPYIGMAAQGHSSHDGVASGSAALFDRQGPIGHSVSVALAHSGFRAPSA
jgi:acyl-CoA thioesterase